MAASSTQSSLRRRYASSFFLFMHMIGIAQIYCTAQSRDVAVHRNTQEESSSSKYKLLPISPFQIQLDVDLSVIVNGEKRQTLRHLLRSNDVGRRLSSGEEGWMTTVVDNTANENNNNKEEEASANDAKPSLNNNGAGEGWFSNNPNVNEYEPPENNDSLGSSSSSITSDNNQESGSGSWYANENSPPKAPKVDPLSSFSAVKDALQQQQPDTYGDKKTFSEYIRILLTEYTTDYVTSVAYEALKSSERAEKGWDVVHAVDLRASMTDVTFYHEETHFIEDSDSDASDQEETFASLTFEFSGTAAILKGTNLDDIVKGNTLDDTRTSTTTSAIHNRPIIGTHELRLMVRSAFAAPDGPYQYLTFILDESRRDEEDFVLDKMSYEDSLEHDATVLLGRSREVIVRTDLDNPGGLAPTWSTLNEQPGSDQAERRESIAVFLEGLFLVVFLGGFYMYASYKFRRNHLKQELMKYGEGAILVKSGEKTLFSPESRSKSKFNFKLKWLKYNRVKNASSPTTMQTLEEDGFFRSESFDSDYNEREDLEMGLKESYDESIRSGGGLDMSPIDVDSDINQVMSSAGVNTMKAVDDDMKAQSSSSAVAGLHENMIENVLENVVPIPAKDDENAAYLMSKKGKKAMSDKGVSIIVQRRYVQPAAPLDVLYGAAFLHGEAERVEAQRRLRKKKKKIRASPSSRNRVKKKKSTAKLLMAQAMSGQRSKNAVNPMMTITESIDEVAEEDYDSDEDLIITASSYSPSKFMQNLSNWVMGAEVGAELNNCAEERDDDDEEDGEDDGEDNDNECPSSAIRAMPESIEDKGNDKEENEEEDIDIYNSERASSDDEILEEDTQDVSSDSSDQVIESSQAQERKEEEEFVLVQDSPSNSGEGLC